MTRCDIAGTESNKGGGTVPKSKDDTRRRYRDEPLARRAVLIGLADDFEFWEEVEAISASGDPFKIDAVSRCRQTGWYLGWEFKRSHLYKSEFADALRQSIHYCLARITDARLPDLASARLPAIVLFPDWLGEHDDDVTNYAGEAEGMRLLAAQLRVGTMREGKAGRLSIFMGQGAIWHSDRGWGKDADHILHGKRGLGAVRKQVR